MLTYDLRVFKGTLECTKCHYPEEYLQLSVKAIPTIGGTFYIPVNITQKMSKNVPQPIPPMPHILVSTDTLCTVVLYLTLPFQI